MIRLLLWIGLVSRNVDGRIVWPFHVPPLWVWKQGPVGLWRHARVMGWCYRFRNLPGVIKWLPGRLLPRRWGFGIGGFEFGDRGSHHVERKAGQS